MMKPTSVEQYDDCKEFINEHANVCLEADLRLLELSKGHMERQGCVAAILTNHLDACVVSLRASNKSREEIVRILNSSVMSILRIDGYK